MGFKFEEQTPTFTSHDGLFIKKKTGYCLALSVLCLCVLIGLLTYFIGVKELHTSNSLNNDKNNIVKINKVTDVRLPRHLIPLNYEIQLIPFIIPNNFTIRGHVKILMHCLIDGSRNVTLHASELTLNLSSISLRLNDRELSIKKHSFDKDREFYIGSLEEELRKGNNYTIEIDFIAKLNNDLKGFYRSSYINSKTGDKEYIAVTQFQATDARRAFPCFDEPALKARFKSSLGRLPEYSSISNMPIANESVAMEGISDYVWDHFEESVPMSTYLVAFVVSKFEFETASLPGSQIEFRVWATSHSLDQIAFAKETGPQILSFYETYFDVKYPLPKQDMIAIPDFAAGAMENWGLITYREVALLFKEGVSSLKNKQRIAIVISHELAHQWFGNLVTPSWWTDLWLNEGFASYVEYLGVDAIYPEMRILEQFIIVDLHSVLKLDSLDSSHPISIPVKHPDEIDEIFDKISYSKGASIIRMMDKFLSTSSFRNGLTAYLIHLKYKAAEQDDLWRILTVQAHKDSTLPHNLTVKDVMDTWTLQKGYPVVTVQRNYDENTAVISQAKFTLLESNNSKDSSTWWIPITFTSVNGDFDQTKNDLWLSEKSLGINNLPSKTEAVIFNVQQTGYYRVNYDDQNWRLIIESLKRNHTSIHVINRAQILSDAFNLAQSGLLNYSIAFSITEYLKNETEYLPWAAALDSLQYIDSMFKRSPAYGEFKKYLKGLILPHYERLGFDGNSKDSYLESYLRILIINWSCKLGHKPCIQKSDSHYQIWINSSNSEKDTLISPDMKDSILCAVIGNSDENNWNLVWNRYLNSKIASEKSSFLLALSCTKETWLLNKYLNMSLTEKSGIRKQDGASVISRIASNTIGRNLAFDFIRDKWSDVIQNYGSSSFFMSNLVKSVMKERNSEFDLNELKTFQSNHELGSATRACSQAIEQTISNINWMNSNYEYIFDWIQKANQQS